MSSKDREKSKYNYHGTVYLKYSFLICFCYQMEGKQLCLLSSPLEEQLSMLVQVQFLFGRPWKSNPYLDKGGTSYTTDGSYLKYFLYSQVL